MLAADNQGPSVGFRVYNPAVVKDANTEFDFEYCIADTEEHKARVAANRRWHREFQATQPAGGLFTNWIEFAAHTDYDTLGRCHKLRAKRRPVFMNPMTTRAGIDIFIASLCAARKDGVCHN